jgi:hypothetical protein
MTAIAVPAAIRTAIRTWGTTRGERMRSFRCDRWLPDADDALYRAIDVDAPPAVVFRWLCQLRVAPYSYDWIDNFGRPSPRHPTPGLERLAVGQRVMRVFELVEFETDRHLTIRSAAGALGTFAVSYVVVARPRGRSRLVVKLLVRWPSGPLAWATRLLLPVGDLVMMRKQLLTLKELAEREERP